MYIYSYTAYWSLIVLQNFSVKSLLTVRIKRKLKWKIFHDYLHDGICYEKKNKYHVTYDLY